MPGRIVAVVVCGAILAGCGFLFPQPRGYDSAAGKYHVELPGTPKENQQNVPSAVGMITAYTTQGIGRGQVAYSVSYMDFPANLINDANRIAALEGACGGMIAEIKATLLQKLDSPLGRNPGRELHFEVKPNTTQGLGIARLYLVGNRMYQLLVVGPKTSFDPAAANAFFDSFRIEGQGPKTGSSQARAVPPSTATAKPTAWGAAEDPDGGSKIDVEGDVATFEVSGTTHQASMEQQKYNWPRLMQPVDGDFTAEVKVAGDQVLADPPAAGSNIAFHGSGLLLWAGEENYIRLERAAFVRGGQVRNYAIFEHHRFGAPVDGEDADCPAGPVHLRLERRGEQVAGSISTDGTNWRSLRPKTFAPTKATVGVAVVNSAAAPFQVRFEGLKVGKP